MVSMAFSFSFTLDLKLAVTQKQSLGFLVRVYSFSCVLFTHTLSLCFFLHTRLSVPPQKPLLMSPESHLMFSTEGEQKGEDTLHLKNVVLSLPHHVLYTHTNICEGIPPTCVVL